MSEDPRRRLPSVDALLGSEAFAPLLRDRPRSRVVEALRRTLDGFRRELAADGDASADSDPPDAEVLARQTWEVLIAEDRPSLRRVINATGVPLHTNLGRAPLAEAARAALADVARGYSNLEYDLERGARGSRHDHAAALLRDLTGAEGAVVVNNNAAAVLVALNELADGRGVIVSRGELVEIGGSFRVPEIVAKSGARVVEVGTTNRTHLEDYERVAGPATGALLKVHRSNFRQTGFVAEVGIGELIELGRRRGIPVVHDLGSGLLPGDEGALGLPPEPGVRRSLELGADLVTFSADKVLGGPQAGVIAGRAELVDRILRNPLVRAIRPGKLTLAALEATLRLWRAEEVVAEKIPAVRMMTASSEALRARVERIADALRERAPAAGIDVVPAVAEIGGGSYPGVELEGWALRLTVPGHSELELEAACRAGDPPVVGRVKDAALLLDPRTVLPDEQDELIKTVAAALARGRS